MGMLRIGAFWHNLLVMDESGEELGPHMLALRPKQRLYVKAMLADPFGNPTEWSRMAGFSDASQGCKVMGHRLTHGDLGSRVLEAVREECARNLGTVGPVLAIGVMLQIARDPKHRRQLDAALALADRSGFHVRTEHHIRVTHVSDDRMYEIAKRMAAEWGIEEAKVLGGNAPAEGAKLIEGEIVAVEVGAEAMPAEANAVGCSVPT